MAEKERGGKSVLRTLNVIGAWALNGVTVNLTAAVMNTLSAAFGTVPFDRAVKVAIVPLSGAAIHAGVIAWANPEAGAILISRVLVDVTTVAGQAGTLSVGTTAVSATTPSANLIDTLDVRTAAGIFDNVIDGGTLGKARQRLATGKWITATEATGNVTGLVGNCYIYYNNV